MDLDDIKKRINKNMILELMEYFNISPIKENEEYIIFPSRCHNSDSPKLYFYKETSSFFCFSQCGHIDLFTIAQQELDLTFRESVEWITNFFQFGKQKGFGKPKKIEYEPRKIEKKEINIEERLPTYEESILNTFVNYKPIEWIIEDISVETMDLFEIKFDINSNSIIIPIRDMYGSLVGIRNRNFDENVIELYGKYGVFTDSLNKLSYKCQTGRLLYGLNINKDKIMECKKIIIVEGEKSVLKSKSWFKENDIAVASFGANLTNFQIEIIKSLGVTDVIFMYDKEEDEKIQKKIEKIYKKCSLLFNVWYATDEDNLLKIKDSPLDCGLDVYRKILENITKYEVTINN